jgi:hypothetical protein
MFRLPILGLFASGVIGHRAHINDEQEEDSAGVPHSISDLNVGTKKKGALVPDLVAPPGTTYEFKVGQYKNAPLRKMEYDWVLHKVNNEVVDKRFAWSKGDSVYNKKDVAKWRLRRRFGAAAYFGNVHLPHVGTMAGNFADTLFFLKPTGPDAKFERGTIGATQKNWKDHAYFTIRRIAMSIPQRWTIHSGFTMGGPPASAEAQEYDRSRIYWIRGHKGTYNAFKKPEDSAVWYCAKGLKKSCHSHDTNWARDHGGKMPTRDDPEVEKLRVAFFTKTVEDGRMTHTVVCKAGADCGLMLTMLQLFRWQHYIEVAGRVFSPSQWRGDYQPDDGLVHKHSKGKRPTSLLAEESEETAEVDEDLDDDLDDVELAEWSDVEMHQQAEEAEDMAQKPEN